MDDARMAEVPTEGLFSGMYYIVDQYAELRTHKVLNYIHNFTIKSYEMDFKMFFLTKSHFVYNNLISFKSAKFGRQMAVFYPRYITEATEMHKNDKMQAARMPDVPTKGLFSGGIFHVFVIKTNDGT